VQRHQHAYSENQAGDDNPQNRQAEPAQERSHSAGKPSHEKRSPLSYEEENCS